MRSVPDEYKDTTYGNASFRRHIKITCAEGSVSGALEDDCHAFSVHLQHDGTAVTGVDAQWQRYPTTTCPGSIEVIPAMVGCPLVDDLLVVKRFTESLEQCTHMHDLTALMVMQASIYARGDCPADVLYESQVLDPDPVSGVQELTLFENGRQVLHWVMKDKALIEPASFRGVTPMKGFIAWAADRLQQPVLLHGFILQMAYFVSRSRPFNFDKLIGVQAQLAGHPANACYASREERMSESFKVDHKRHFHDCPEQMLRFVESR